MNSHFLYIHFTDPQYNQHQQREESFPSDNRFTLHDTIPADPISPNQPDQSGHTISFPIRATPLPAPDPFALRLDNDEFSARVYIDEEGIFKKSFPTNLPPTKSNPSQKMKFPDTSEHKIEKDGLQTLYDGRPVFVD